MNSKEKPYLEFQQLRNTSQFSQLHSRGRSKGPNTCLMKFCREPEASLNCSYPFTKFCKHATG